MASAVEPRAQVAADTGHLCKRPFPDTLLNCRTTGRHDAVRKTNPLGGAPGRLRLRIAILHDLGPYRLSAISQALALTANPTTFPPASAVAVPRCDQHS